jgi:hypothetical protein
MRERRAGFVEGFGELVTNLGVVSITGTFFPSLALHALGECSVVATGSSIPSVATVLNMFHHHKTLAGHSKRKTKC